MCKRESPCGGILRIDTDILSDTQHIGTPVVIQRCLNGHTFRESPVPTLVVRRGSQWCQAHQMARPCAICVELSRRARARVAPKACRCKLCGRPYQTTGGRNKYCPVCRKIKICTPCQTRHLYGICPTARPHSVYRWRRSQQQPA
jgi:hypothetical protein